MKRIIILLWIGFLISVVNAQAGVPGFMKARMGTLKGQFFTEFEKPHAKGIVSFFNKTGGPPPIMGSARRVPDMVSRTDDIGQFSVKLLPGKYYMGALIRDASQGPGPPRKGEKYFFAMAEDGKLRLFEVKTKKESVAGHVVGNTPDKFKEFKNFVTIRGVITDEVGNPFKGVMATVKEKMNSPRPKFVSELTGDDGRYELNLPPGKYFIMVRESLRGGRPRPGSYVGTYGKTAPAGDAAPANAGGVSGGAPPGIGTQGGGGEAISIDAKEGKVYEDINISMYKIPDPEETRRKYEKEARKRKEKK